MPIFPYDEEEERRRRMLTPGFNPGAKLPELSTPSPRMLPPPGNPGALPAPDYNPKDMAPPSRYQRLEAEKQGYMRGTPGRGKSALTGALEGLASGGLIGAAAGGLTGAISPRRLREQQFESRQKPQILERFGYEDQAAAQERQAGQDALNNQYRQAQIGELESQAYKNRLPPPKRAPVHSDRGLYDMETGGIIPGTEPLPKPETPSYQDILDPDGKIRKYQIFPGRPPIPVGESGAAAINQANIKSHEGIAARREAGENSRAAQRQSASKKETIPMSKVRAYAKARGLKIDEAKAQILNEGFKITGSN